MTDGIVTWKQGIAFNGRGQGESDLPIGTGPHDFRPLELLVIGLASCSGMDFVSILEKKRQQVSALEIKVHADKQEDCPNAFTKARLEFIVSGHAIQEAAVVRAIELSATRYCPAYSMFSKIFPIDLDYSIFEELGDGERKLVTSGSYIPIEQPESIVQIAV